MASLIYNSFVHEVNTGQINPSTASFKAQLMAAAHVPNKDTHTRRSDGSADEVSGTGYTAGGAVVTCTVAKDNTNDRVTLTFTSPSWATSTITAQWLRIYVDRGGAATADELVCIVDNGSAVSSTNGTFTFTISTPLTYQN